MGWLDPCFGPYLEGDVAFQKTDAGGNVIDTYEFARLARHESELGGSPYVGSEHFLMVWLSTENEDVRRSILTDGASRRISEGLAEAGVEAVESYTQRYSVDTASLGLGQLVRAEVEALKEIRPLTNEMAALLSSHRGSAGDALRQVTLSILCAKNLNVLGLIDAVGEDSAQVARRAASILGSD